MDAYRDFSQQKIGVDDEPLYPAWVRVGCLLKFWNADGCADIGYCLGFVTDQPFLRLV